jgi:hypothetical protein
LDDRRPFGDSLIPVREPEPEYCPSLTEHDEVDVQSGALSARREGHGDLVSDCVVADPLEIGDGCNTSVPAVGWLVASSLARAWKHAFAEGSE